MVHVDGPVGLDAVAVAFDDRRAVADAGIVLPATLARRLGVRVLPPPSTSVAPRWIAVAAVVSVVLPAVGIALSRPLERAGAQEKTVLQDFESGNILTPVDTAVRLDVEQEGASRRLSWTSGGSWRADVFYRVYRHDGPDDDTLCVVSHGTAWYCYLTSEPIATTRDLSFVDPDAPPTATYRIGVGTNWADDPAFGDVFAFSPPVEVGAPG